MSLKSPLTSNKLFPHVPLASSILSLISELSFCWICCRLVISILSLILLFAKIKGRCWKIFEERLTSASISASERRTSKFCESRNWFLVPLNSASFFLFMLVSNLSIVGIKRDINLAEALPWESQGVVAHFINLTLRRRTSWRSPNTVEFSEEYFFVSTQQELMRQLHDSRSWLRLRHEMNKD